jgi:hypothetical protein
MNSENQTSDPYFHLRKTDEEMEPKTPIEEGDRGTITLVYKRDGEEDLDVEVEVQVDQLENEDGMMVVSIPYQSPMIVIKGEDFTPNHS